MVEMTLIQNHKTSIVLYYWQFPQMFGRSANIHYYMITILKKRDYILYMPGHKYQSEVLTVIPVGVLPSL